MISRIIGGAARAPHLRALALGAGAIMGAAGCGGGSGSAPPASPTAAAPARTAAIAYTSDQLLARFPAVRGYIAKQGIASAPAPVVLGSLELSAFRFRGARSSCLIVPAARQVSGGPSGLTVQCEKARTIARRGVASTMGPLPGHGSNVAAVFGMAPPRATKVVIYADGAERSLPVRDGVFGIAVRTPRSVRFVLPDGVTPSLPLKVGPGAA